MLKSNLQVTPKVFALPLEIAWERQTAYTVFAVRFLCFLWQVISVNVPKVEELPPPTPQRSRANISATKAYADERQKSKHRRRRKPSKAMKNLYQLS